MKIVIDQKILLAKEAFSTIGEVSAYPGSDIDDKTLVDADVLVTRTTTKVSPKILSGSAIKFVATATAGTDHVNLDYLKQQGIGFTSAPGCNSVAVGEFVINVLVCLSAIKSSDLTGKTLGIIGAGNAGTALKSKAECLGIKCLFNDPPLYDLTGEKIYKPLPELLQQSDIISLHVPLTTTGQHPTYHLINDESFQHIKPGSTLINTSRGGVIDEAALIRNRQKLANVILDVWEGEPDLNDESLELCDIATPHIAGYSIDGKLKATEIVYRKTCEFFNIRPSWQSPRETSPPEIISIGNSQNTLKDLFQKVYNVFDDDLRLRQIQHQQDPARYFRSLRNEYEFRKEFSNFQLQLTSEISQQLKDTIRCLGFNL